MNSDQSLIWATLFLLGGAIFQFAREVTEQFISLGAAKREGRRIDPKTSKKVRKEKQEAASALALRRFGESQARVNITSIGWTGILLGSIFALCSALAAASEHAAAAAHSLAH